MSDTYRKSHTDRLVTLIDKVMNMRTINELVAYRKEIKERPKKTWYSDFVLALIEDQIGKRTHQRIKTGEC